MKTRTKLSIGLLVLILTSIACGVSDSIIDDSGNTSEDDVPTPTVYDPPEPVTDGGFDVTNADPEEPVVITGTIPFTSPFFINLTAEPFVLLEDQAGFYARDEDFVFELAGQTIGPVWEVDEQTYGFSLTLPSIPQATFLDVDNNNQEDKGLMVFQVAFWSNTWGGPFLEKREGTGWSGAYTSALVDPERDGEIIGGTLLIWAPDDQQQFPTGFGEDNELFTEDDPVISVPAGYSLVNLDEEPFRIYKESNPELTLVEGPGEVNDLSDLRRADAFEALFEDLQVEYPFTAEKNIDWDALYAKYAPLVADISTTTDYYVVIKNFLQEIPDGHVGVGFNDEAIQYFYDTNGGSFGMILAELSDGRVIVTDVLPGFAAAGEGIEVGAEILTWQGEPVQDAIAKVNPFFGPYSTDHHRRAEQLVFMTRFPPDTRVTFSFRNPGGAPTETTLTATVDYDSLFEWIPTFREDPITLPIEAELINDDIAYMKIKTFSDDYNLMAQVYEYHIKQLIDSGIRKLILDLRVNGGGSGGLAADFYGYFIEDEIEVSQHAYYNYDLGEFEYGDEPATLEPGPMLWEGEIVVLVSEYCASACEGFAYWLTLLDDVTVIGHTPTAGMFGEVGQGQYALPGDIELQVPTGRPETLDGELLIEGVGVIPDIVVPVTFESATGQVDTILQEAISILD
jgi:C-terminal processing protease CtpA/Prc